MEKKIKIINDFFKQKKVLITGSSGYIATGIINVLSKVECTLIRVSKNTDKLEDIDGDAEIIDVRSDLTKYDKWEELLSEIDIIYHLAAQTSVPKANSDPIADYLFNVLPMINMLIACDKLNICPTIVFAGTVTEMGISKYLPVDEDHYEKPITIYDIHKLMAEKYLEFYSSCNKVQGCTLRLANVYGPGKESSSADRGVLNLMIRKAINGEELTIYGEGNYLRDYIYIDDVVDAFILSAINSNDLNGNHYIIGKGEGTTIAKLVKIISRRVEVKTGKSVKINSVQEPSTLSAIDKRNFIAKNDKFKAITGWKPKYDLIKGIDKTIEIFLNSN